MQEEDGLPSQEAAETKGLVWERSGEGQKAWVLVLTNTGLASWD